MFCDIREIWSYIACHAMHVLSVVRKTLKEMTLRDVMTNETRKEFYDVVIPQNSNEWESYLSVYDDSDKRDEESELDRMFYAISLQENPERYVDPYVTRARRLKRIGGLQDERRWMEDSLRIMRGHSVGS